MTYYEIPGWLELETGAHRDQCGVCLEECLALLLEQEKTDRPDGVHSIIREVGVSANDAESDPEKRRLLAKTLGCQVGTADVSEEITRKLAAFVCRFSASRLPDDADERVGAALCAAAECLENPTVATRAGAAWEAWAPEAVWEAWAAGAAWAARAAFYADLLDALLDEFDRLTGRTECHTFEAADWERVRNA